MLCDGPAYHRHSAAFTRKSCLVLAEAASLRTAGMPAEVTTSASRRDDAPQSHVRAVSRIVDSAAASVDTHLWTHNSGHAPVDTHLWTAPVDTHMWTGICGSLVAPSESWLRPA